MGVLIRGAKNAFRNTIRTFSVTIILAISIGLALIMLLSYRTVEARITSVKSSIGNTITLSPAGAQGFEGGGEPLTDAEVSGVKTVPHVTGITETLQARMTSGTDTNLVSAVDAGTLGNRQGRQNLQQAGGTPPQGANGQTRTFTVPLIATGITDTSILSTGSTSLVSGSAFEGSSTADQVVVGQSLATKNSLSVGSTLTMYGTTMTVTGIFNVDGNTFANNGVYVPLATLQTLTAEPGQVSSATVQIDSIDNVTAAFNTIKTQLSGKADATSTQDQATTAIAPLENIKNISFYALIGSLVAGALITLLTMVMIVRERRREIGVLKAIGASNTTVVGQFVAESLVLTLLGSLVGAVIGFVFSNPVLNALVSSNTTTTTATTFAGRGGGGGFARNFGQLGQAGGVRSALQNIHATVGYDVLLYGLLAAVVIAIIGSALPAFLIAKVKPAEVMRAD